MMRVAEAAECSFIFDIDADTACCGGLQKRRDFFIRGATPADREPQKRLARGERLGYRVNSKDVFSFFVRSSSGPASASGIRAPHRRSTAFRPLHLGD